MPGISREGEQVTDVVNGLEGLIKNNLLRTSVLDSDLAHCGLGIDASHYIRQLYARDSIRKSLSSGLGGIPLCFRKEVENDLDRFKKLDIGLLVVFDGLDLYNFNLKEKGMKVDSFVGKRKVAWDSWQRLAERGRFTDGKERSELEKKVYDAFEQGMLFVDAN
jgi:hypothetical protein